MDELTFTGCPMKQVVKIRPTKECLVALSEFPFFVLDVNDIEVVHFERMYYGIKNFDLAVIKKDFTTCIRINSIPTEYTEELKSYFNGIGIIFLESMAPLKWDLILTQIREDFTGWLDQGAW
jgi:nucleosome binding factor SPN SPT16 subunit